MSVISYDGEVIAADRQATCSDCKTVCEKLFRIDPLTVVGVTGDIEVGLELIEWFKAGSKIEDWPEIQSKENWSRLIVAGRKKPGARPYCYFFETRPYAQIVRAKFAAWGSGRDYALGAMSMGADAIHSVRVASKHSTGCGLGITAFKL